MAEAGQRRKYCERLVGHRRHLRQTDKPGTTHDAAAVDVGVTGLINMLPA